MQVVCDDGMRTAQVRAILTLCSGQRGMGREEEAQGNTHPGFKSFWVPAGLDWGRELTVTQSHGGCSKRLRVRPKQALPGRPGERSQWVPTGSYWEGCLHATQSACTWEGGGPPGLKAGVLGAHTGLDGERQSPLLPLLQTAFPAHPLH